MGREGGREGAGEMSPGTGRLAHEAVVFLRPSSEQFTPWKGLTQSNWRSGFTGKQLERTQTTKT